jgi:hypothetical protein
MNNETERVASRSGPTLYISKLLTRQLVAARPSKQLSEFFGTIFEAVPSSQRVHAAIILASTEYCIAVTSHWIERCHDTTHRLRPSESLALEVSQLVHDYARQFSWQGPCFCLVSPQRASLQALLSASALLLNGHTEVTLACELLPRASAWQVQVLLLTTTPVGPIPMAALPAAWRERLAIFGSQGEVHADDCRFSTLAHCLTGANM